MTDQDEVVVVVRMPRQKAESLLAAHGDEPDGMWAQAYRKALDRKPGEVWYAPVVACKSADGVVVGGLAPLPNEWIDRRVMVIPLEKP